MFGACARPGGNICLSGKLYEIRQIYHPPMSMASVIAHLENALCSTSDSGT